MACLTQSAVVGAINVAKSSWFAPTWRAGRRCLIPAKYVLGPSYPEAYQDQDGKWVLAPCV